MSTSFYTFTMKNIRGENTPLENFKGKVALVVNVASECGLTPQYEGLEKIYEKYQEKGFAVLGFPANEFGAQEPGSNAEIQNFSLSKFGIKFPMFEKIVVKGDGQHPLYRFLIEKKPVATLKEGVNFEQQLKEYGIVREKKEDILWNFEKFLIGRDGEVIARFSPDITPEDPIIIQAIEAAL
ncbi:glutathione peroxidase [Bdellovibrio bacteriovorus]|uniref:Glutathione peroxidase n=1 Tax=Bdellovibrio bacteriovorus TaxID=959 RepID=A0A162GQM9_BDEBC|nr:glutathione peroxidase [Bdellovibrio bacteriovorus]KYG68717.1 glutathione peroxidase [Bdellovibrio bacteriovorus]